MSSDPLNMKFLPRPPPVSLLSLPCLFFMLFIMTWCILCLLNCLFSAFPTSIETTQEQALYQFCSSLLHNADLALRKSEPVCVCWLNEWSALWAILIFFFIHFWDSCCFPMNFYYFMSRKKWINIIFSSMERDTKTIIYWKFLQRISNYLEELNIRKGYQWYFVCNILPTLYDR